jgi:quercetin dioxygenase-like cupin family protein
MNTWSLPRLAEQQLATAKDSPHGRSALTVHGGRDHDLRQTLIALAGGAHLQDHESPGEASLQVLQGEVRVTADADTWTGLAGDYLVLPSERHALEAVTDAVVLLTVATRA